MATEIERKFLVDDMPELRGLAGEPMVQGYLRADPGGSVRVRIGATGAMLNVKGPTQGLTRLEFEYPIPESDAREMLAALQVGEPVEKVRYRIPYRGFVWELDVFGGANHGLVIAEVELQDAAVEPPLPTWVGDEVSGDGRFSNAYLTRHPYSRWAQDADAAAEP